MGEEGEEGEELTGFTWRGGIERDTTGILMWSKPYIIPLPNSREEVAVLLLDTQGAFDNQSTVKDCATIFALSTMVSSLQVYNLSGLIQENDLQHLHLFTEYGRLAMEENSGIKPFQVKRNILCVALCEIGATPMIMSLERREAQTILRKSYRQASSLSTDYYISLPHPEDIDSSFKENLAQLVPLLVSGEGLMVKKINGNPVTGSGLLDCFQVSWFY
ncbi:Atlastin-1 [Geodia barretti]|uniref:Atlastin-1 n=1 Tax=Geodia barretti TaxID=519541 RepID=A0AA35RQ18_GEOBA|nr:Atlastin-1 [Geodia barretti]